MWNQHYYRIKGNRHYELTNHLGNVLAVVTDRKMGIDTTADTNFNPQYYLPDLYSVQNYYAFGQDMPKWSTSTLNDPKRYRFGFNGKEDDDEWGKQDYGFRIYDGRVGRFLSVDPISRQYPELTPYQFASNTPIWAIDLDGLEASTTTRPSNTQVVSPRSNRNSGGYSEVTTSQSGVPITTPQQRINPIDAYYNSQSELQKSESGTSNVSGGSKAAWSSTGTAVDNTNPVPGNPLKINPPKIISPTLTWDQSTREKKLEEYIASKRKKDSGGSDWIVYELRAKKDGWYTCVPCDVAKGNVDVRLAEEQPPIPFAPKYEIKLYADELWKIGQTKNGEDRYKNDPYVTNNFSFFKVNSGTETAMKIDEKRRIVMFPFHPENISRSQTTGTYLPRPPASTYDK
jgi:RHS repeat-associated protein